MSKINRNQPAFPAMPAQDNLGRVFTPFPGLTQYEYVMLQFALTGAQSELSLPDQVTDEHFAAAIMEGAKVLTDAFFKAVTIPEQTTEATLIKM
jgi:hypothetical protein